MEELLVADSFRVRLNPETGAAEVRRFDWHLERFRASAARAVESVDPGWWSDVFDPFLEEARGRIAAAGEGFPRIELRRDDACTDGEPAVRPNLLLRPLPALAETVDLRTAPAQALSAPRIKGPDLELLGALNRRLGAEALLIDSSGRAVEGATTSLAWWRDGVLCTSAVAERIGSVTERMVLEAASELGIATSQDSATPGELAGREVWALNALQGIRVVASLDGTPSPPPDADRLREFRDALESSWRPVLPDQVTAPRR